MVTGSNQGEIDGYQDVGKSGKCHTGSVSGRIYPGGLDVDSSGTDTEG